jgi:hypothetical protein
VIASSPAAETRNRPAYSSVKLRAHVVAVPSGQVTVQHDDVVVGKERPIKSCCAVVRDVHGQLFLAQPGRDRVGQFAVVLDDKYPHNSHHGANRVAQR